MWKMHTTDRKYLPTPNTFINFKYDYMEVHIMQNMIPYTGEWKLFMHWNFLTLHSGINDAAIHCDQIGPFLSGPIYIFSYKSNPNIWQLLRLLSKNITLSESAVTTFWATLEEIGLLFISTSGHIATQNVAISIRGPLTSYFGLGIFF